MPIAPAAKPLSPKTPTEKIIIKVDEALREYDAEVIAIHEAQAERMRRFAAEQEQRRVVIARHPSSAGGEGRLHDVPATKTPPAGVIRRAIARIASLVLSPAARSEAARALPQGAGKNATAT